MLEKTLGIAQHVLLALVKKSALEKKSETVLREAAEIGQAVGRYDITLSAEQQDAVNRIAAGFDAPAKPWLLYGITGSGKTHVYIELARQRLAQGRGVIVLVPEISLTPQVIQRFHSALGDCMAVIHSRMSDGERRDSLEELVSGRKQMVIGVRSAILAPVHNLGLIIVDEEHDNSYKQDDLDPRYQGRDVAVMRGHLQQAAVVLGSATPCFETYQNALTGKYELLKLSSRFGAARLPQVEIIDMNEEHRQDNWKLLSRRLVEEITKTIAEKRQVILLLNRRGFSVSLICKDCGKTYKCPNCSVHLVYHRVGTQLRCHQCGYMEQAPEVCSGCSGQHLKYQGTGIQKAEELLVETFPDVRIIRMDQDSTRRKGAHVSILSAFENREADILLGTQMVAKGLNFPGVRLVGVIQADTGLHFPDFRASERTFQLLTQVAGRAGRDDDNGLVIVQTYLPEEPAVISATTHDYETFFANELVCRQELSYPPFTRLVRIIAEGTAEAEVRQVAEQAARICRTFAKEGLSVLGPSPATIAQRDSSWRYALVVKSQNTALLGIMCRSVRQSVAGKFKNVKMIIDVDPVNML
jgi:primosomal protein N' (replication factor Y)